MRLMLKVGKKCEQKMNDYRSNLYCERIEADEIWTFVNKKQKNLKCYDNWDEISDQYVFVVLDSDTKIVPFFIVGKRTSETATIFVRELHKRVRSDFSYPQTHIKAILKQYIACSVIT